MKRIKNSSTLYLFSVLITGILFLTSCEELEDNNTDPEITVTANAGNDMTVGVGEEVVLDGSASSTSICCLDYSWEFTSIPSGSNASIQNPRSEVAAFTPDVEGDYQVELSVANEGNTDADNITVTASAAAASTQEISGDINQDVTWTNLVDDPAIPDYHIVGNVGLNAKLTIEPGVLIHVDEDRGMWVNSEGSIFAEGQSGNEIVFTSSNEAGQLHWKGILVKSADATNKIEHTIIRYAGNSEFNHAGSNYAHALGIEGGKLSLLNTVVENSDAYGFFHHSGEILDFSSNEFVSNADYAIRIPANQVGQLDGATSFDDADKAVNIYGSTLNLEEEAQWKALTARMNARYYVSDDIQINSYLQIMPGAKFDFAENTYLSVGSDGTIIADAAEAEEIEFTSKQAFSGIFWKGIYISSNDARNILSNVKVSYAGNSEWGFSGTDYPGAIGIENGKLSLVNSTVSNSKAHGLYFHSGEFEQFGSNTFADNGDQAIVMMAEQVGKLDASTSFSGNDWDGVTIYSSTVTQDATWPNLSGTAKYRALGWLYAEAGLTLQPGVEIAFDQDKALLIKNVGHFIASGTSSEPIVFTSSNEAGQIKWAGIWIQSSDARNEMNYTEVNLAGSEEFGFSGSNYAAAIAGDNADNPRLTLTNSIVQNSDSYAVYWEGGIINDVESPSANNTFINNGEDPDVVIP